MREAAARSADEGVAHAERAALAASPLVVEATGPIWEAIVRTADEHDVSAIVMRSRGLSAVKVLLGSVSSGVVHHAHRPTLVVPPAEE